MRDDSDDLNMLNSNVHLDFFTVYNRIYHDHAIDDTPYIGITLSSKYYDVNSLSNAAFLQRKSI